MAVFTELTGRDVAAIGLAYGFDDIVSLVGLTDGDHDSSYLLSTRDGDHFVTVFETAIASADLHDTFAVMTRLADAGIPCPRPRLTLDGAPLVVTGGKSVAIVGYRGGVALHRINPAQATDLGRQLARIRLTLNPDAPGGSGLPRGMVHGAFGRDNVFFIGDCVSSVINYRTRHVDVHVAELADVLVAWCGGTDEVTLDPLLACALLAGYQSIVALTPIERVCLPAFVMIAAAGAASGRGEADHAVAEMAKSGFDAATTLIG